MYFNLFSIASYDVLHWPLFILSIPDSVKCPQTLKMLSPCFHRPSCNKFWMRWKRIPRILMKTCWRLAIVLKWCWKNECSSRFIKRSSRRNSLQREFVSPSQFCFHPLSWKMPLGNTCTDWRLLVAEVYCNFKLHGQRRWLLFAFWIHSGSLFKKEKKVSGHHPKISGFESWPQRLRLGRTDKIFGFQTCFCFLTWIPKSKSIFYINLS